MSLDENERIIRRGQQIFQLALRMEIGDEPCDKDGAETLIYLANAIAYAAALSEDPRLAIETVVRLFDKIGDRWFAKNHEQPHLQSAEQLLANIAFETALGKRDAHTADGTVAAGALAYLTDAVVCVAALNSSPRQIIEHVVERLDTTDVDAVRKEQLK